MTESVIETPEDVIEWLQEGSPSDETFPRATVEPPDVGPLRLMWDHRLRRAQYRTSGKFIAGLFKHGEAKDWSIVTEGYVESVLHAYGPPDIGLAPLPEPGSFSSPKKVPGFDPWAGKQREPKKRWVCGNCGRDEHRERYVPSPACRFCEEKEWVVKE